MISLIFSVFLGLFASPADVARARSLYESGSVAYRDGNYLVAIEAFDEANRLVSRPPVVFSLAQALRLQFFVDGRIEHLERAVATYHAYVEAVPEGGRRDHAVGHLSTLEPMLQRLQAGPEAPAGEATARLIVSSEVPGAHARVDGGPAASIPATFEVAPGERRVVVEAAEHQPEARTILAVAGSAVALNLDPEPLPGRLTVEAPAGAHIFLNGQSLGESPLDGAVEAPAGAYVVVVTQGGRLPFEQPLALGRNQTVTLGVDLETSPQRMTALGLLGASVGLAIGSGVVAGLALSSESDAGALEDRHRSQGLTVAEAGRYQDLLAERDDRASWATGLGVAAGGVALTAVLLWLFDEPKAPRPILGAQRL